MCLKNQSIAIYSKEIDFNPSTLLKAFEIIFKYNNNKKISI